MTMLLSIIAHSRNDDYMGNVCWRMQTCLNKWGKNLEELNVNDVEIVFCDWGSKTPLKDTLHLGPEIRKRLKYVFVDHNTAKSVEGDSEYSSVHATNTSARRCVGKYLIYLDIDVYFSKETFNTLINYLRDGNIGTNSLSNTFYWASRYHVPKVFNDKRPTIDELDDYSSKHYSEFKHDILNPHNFMGATCALVISRDMWNDAGGVDESLKYWGTSDIDIHRRLCMKYKFGGDLEHYGMRFFHLEHYSTHNRNRELENPRKANPPANPSQFNPNGEAWGLRDMQLPIMNL